MAKSRVLYVAPLLSPFVRKDLEILVQKYSVKYFDFSRSGKFALATNLVKQFCFLTWNILGSEALFVMFGGYHAFLPSLFGRMLGKKVFIILGGTDCVSYPSINYGTFRKPMQGKVTCASYRLAHRLLPVHRSLMFREESYYSIDSKYQGCQFWCNHLETPYTEIHNGYDSEKWKPDGSKKQPNTFLTIAAIPDKTKIVLKGIDLVIQAAKSFPNCSFTIVGLQDASIEICDEPNVTVLPFLSAEQLLQILSTTRFYLQLSISEGFPNALCEAMLTECIPIGSNVAAIPDIIGQSGFVLKKRNITQLTALLAQALNTTELDILGKDARQRIVEHYPLESRSKGLMNVLGQGQRPNRSR
jgi:glycosyltransferase involved in cell wall biosynthesis